MKPEKEAKKVECPKDEQVVTLGVDETIFFEFHRHGSVGEDAEFEIGDESVLTHLRTETEYIHPEKMKYPGWTGGDAEKGMWFFKTIKTGKTTLTFSKIFRGTLESKCTLQIVVE
jgi:hypothetical protein